MTGHVDIAALRKEYSLQSLDEAQVDPHPYRQFKKWFAEAAASQIIEPNAMVLATVDSSGTPSARAVLLKEHTEQGYVFFTNYQSQKAKDLEYSPKAALLFYWAELERQVRIVGEVERVSREQTEAYFKKRPRSAQLGALASVQSALLPHRQALEARVKELDAQYQGQEVPCPETWGGYRLVPSRYEFWQGRESRLHDRILYSCSGQQWVRARLSP